MSKDYRLYLNDILLACEKIIRYTTDATFERFEADEMRVDAVLRNLTIVGEAVKQLPQPFRDQNMAIEWTKIARFRDLAIHRYFAVDLQIVWDIVQNHLPPVLAYLQSLPTDSS
jgi:uncharacterized protein with HEPN domain